MLKVVLGLVGITVVYVVVTFLQIWRAAGRDGARPAQAIVVLGAAQYDGQPSAVLAARLDHAIALYQRDLAPLIVVTGGKQPGDRFTEAEASATYLSSKGVPGAAVERETTSTDSYGQLAAVARFLKERGVTEVLLVSDPFHAFRIAAIADEVGLDARVSPTRTSPVQGGAELRAMVRETVAVSVGRIIGFGRESRIQG